MFNRKSIIILLVISLKVSELSSQEPEPSTTHRLTTNTASGALLTSNLTSPTTLIPDATITPIFSLTSSSLITNITSTINFNVTVTTMSTTKSTSITALLSTSPNITNTTMPTRISASTNPTPNTKLNITYIIMLSANSTNTTLTPSNSSIGNATMPTINYRMITTANSAYLRTTTQKPSNSSTISTTMLATNFRIATSTRRIRSKVTTPKTILKTKRFTRKTIVKITTPAKRKFFKIVTAKRKITTQRKYPKLFTTRSTRGSKAPRPNIKNGAMKGPRYEMICVDPIAQCICKLCIDIEFNGVGTPLMWKAMNKSSPSQHWQRQGYALVNRLNNLVMTSHLDRSITLEYKLPGSDDRQQRRHDFRYIGQKHVGPMANYMKKLRKYPDDEEEDEEDEDYEDRRFGRGRRPSARRRTCIKICGVNLEVQKELMRRGGRLES